MNRESSLIIGVALAALLLWPRKAAAKAFDPGIDVRYGSNEPWPDESIEYFAGGTITPGFESPATPEDYEILGLGLPTDLPEGEVFMDTPGQNEQAFLYMLRRAEHSASDVADGSDYQTFYGGSRIMDLSDHPVLTGEKKGVRLTDAQCRAAGFGTGCVSTAAGAYQIIKPSWMRVRERAPRLPDFAPEHQDEAALRLLDEAGARRYVRAGEFDAAIALASRLWASLPGSTSGQPQRSYAELAGFYAQAGGVA